MNSLRKVPSGSLIAVIVTTVTIILTAYGYVSSHQDDAELLPSIIEVHTKTSLEIEKYKAPEESRSKISVTVKNPTKVPVTLVNFTGYFYRDGRIIPNDTFGHLKDYFGDVDHYIAPNTSRELSFSLPVSNRPIDKYIIELDIVMYADKSSEGDFSRIDEIQADRFGMFVQYTQMIPYYDALISNLKNSSFNQTEIINENKVMDSLDQTKFKIEDLNNETLKELNIDSKNILKNNKLKNKFIDGMTFVTSEIGKEIEYIKSSSKRADERINMLREYRNRKQELINNLLPLF